MTDKGASMEELLRNYFLDLGYYVVRGADLHYKTSKITDVDLMLYGRFSSFSKERINVDIKNKNKGAKAYERMMWAKGLQTLLEFDGCVVATTGKQKNIRLFGTQLDIKVLDGLFLEKLKKYKFTSQRISEEAFLEPLKKKNYSSLFKNQTYLKIFEDSKSRLLDQMTFSGFIQSAESLKFFLDKCHNTQLQEPVCRVVYAICSYLLITLDFLVTDIGMLEKMERQEYLEEGIRYGDKGANNMKKTLEMVSEISGNKKAYNLFNQGLEAIPADILAHWFSQNDKTRLLFKQARDFEGLAYHPQFFPPEEISQPLKEILCLFLDFSSINRRKFFNSFPMTQKVMEEE